jgi:hypothetical protein
VTTNRVPTLFILGGEQEGLTHAKNCGAVHIDHYRQVDPQEVDGGVQAHVEEKTHALLLLDAAEKIYVYPDLQTSSPTSPERRW